jgi:tRNA/tmRNA/rRNA uracil-C5-methylase (TrmA/RlmC/RlmD family)
MEALGKLFGTPARLKILRLFLFNEDTPFTPADAAFRAKVTLAATRKEIALLVSAGILKKKNGKGKTYYQANGSFPHYEQLLVFLRSTTSVKDINIINTFKKAGTLRAVVLSGIFTGVLEPKVDVLIVGDRLDERSIKAAIHSIEAELGRELRYASFATPDFRYRAGVYDRLIRDVMDYPHRTIFDKIGL